MAKARSQLWVVSILFIVLGMVLGVGYQRCRSGDIQAAEGRREYEAGRYDLSAAAYERATKSDETNGEAWYWLGMSLRNQGKAAKAADAFEKATALKPDRALWWLEYAQALQWSERFAEAEQAWIHAIEELKANNPRVTEAKVNMAKCIGAQGNVDRAIDMLEGLLKESDERQVRFALAEVLAWGGRFEESADQYRRALGSPTEK